MSTPSKQREDEWFPEAPEYSTLLEWREPAEEELGATPAAQYLRVAFWPFLAHNATVDLTSNAVLRCEPARPYGVLVEGMASVTSQDSAKCQSVEVHYSFAVLLSEDLQGNRPLDAAPTIVAVWPKGGGQTPSQVVRSWNEKGELELRFPVAGVKAGGDRTWQQQYELLEPRDLNSIDPPASPRRVRWICRGTSTQPSVEGTFHAGVWIAHDVPCYARVTAEVEATGGSRRLGWYRRTKVAARPTQRAFGLQTAS
ncbi:MAG: hypothetical protein IT580_25010 [Verrucomicrobiales bacterium]|nr:hypothetical protein [Verrucomicrobiales bacterium]